MPEEMVASTRGGRPREHLRSDDNGAEVERALAIVGASWFAQRMRREIADRKATEAASQRRKMVRRKEAHSSVQGHIEFDAWQRARTEKAETPVTQTVALLASFSRSLQKAQKANGLHRVIPRLHIDDDFLATVFEIETACSYLNRGWSVEFVEPGDQRSPDLKVVTEPPRKSWRFCGLRQATTAAA